MTNTSKKIFKFLPIAILVIVFILSATPAEAFSMNPLDWIQTGLQEVADVALETAASALGIDLSECALPVNESSRCLFCPMFEILFNSASYIAAISYQAFKSDLGSIVIIFLAVSLALTILKNVASMGTRDPGAFMNDIIGKAFVCTAIYVIIKQDYYNMLNLTISPIIEDTLNLLQGNNTSCRVHFGRLGGYASNMGAGTVVNEGGVISRNIGSMILTAICDIEQKIYVLFDYADWALCRGMGPDRIWKIVPNPIYLIDGVLLYIGGIFFLVAYPWIMADAVLQLGIAMALFPFAVVGYAFSKTKQYLPKLFQWILHSLFVFIFMAILLSSLLEYIGRFLSGGSGIFSRLADFAVVFTDPNIGIAFYGPNMMKIIFILVVCWLYMPLIKELAGNFSKGSSLNAAGKIGQSISNKMGDLAEKGADAAIEKTSKAAVAGVTTIGRTFNTGRRQGAKFITNRFGHLDANGNREFIVGGRFAPTWLTRGLTFTTEKNATTVVQDDNGNTIGKTAERNRIAFDSNGNVIGYVNDANEVIRADGSNMGSLNANGEIVDSSGNVIAKAGQEHTMVYDNSGNILGFVDDDGNVKDLNGTTVGQIDANGSVLDSNGSTIGSIYKSGEVAYDSSGNIMGYIDSEGKVHNNLGEVIGIRNAAGDIESVVNCSLSEVDVVLDPLTGQANCYVDTSGQLRDRDGNVVGSTDSSGNIYDLSGTIIAHTGNRLKLALNRDGTILGAADASGNILDDTGSVIARTLADGTIVNGHIIGRSGGNHHLAYDAFGTPIGYISADGSVYNFNNNALGKVTKSKESVLRREYKGLDGRRYVRITDKYTIIKQEYDRSGRLVKNEVEFRHNFMKKYLFDDKGRVNIEALQTVLNSELGRNPKYRQAILSQVAIMGLEKKDKKIGKYFSSRKVHYDPANPNKIFIEQIDHNGKKTNFGVNINMTTGQVAFDYAQKTTDTHLFHKTEREARINLHKQFLNRAGHYTNAGTVAYDTMFGTHYELHRDTTTGEEYYTRERKKYWFFGANEIKEFHADGTIRHTRRSTRSVVNDTKSIADIQKKLNGASKSKHLFYTYESHVDAAGNTIYSSNLRSGWNVKNYGRFALRTTKLALKTPKLALKVATYPIMHPAKTLKTAAYPILHPVKTFKAIGTAAKKARHPITALRSSAGFAWSHVSSAYAGVWQTGDIRTYTPTGKIKTDSLTGDIKNSDLDFSTTVENLDGSKSVTDNLTRETFNYDKETFSHCEIYKNNGVFELNIKGDIDSHGRSYNETTKFKYSDEVQKDHDSITSMFDDNQVVDSSGSISDKLQSTIGTSGQANPNDFTMGIDDLVGNTSIAGQSTRDFLVNNIFAEGRRRQATKMSTRILSSIRI